MGVERRSRLPVPKSDSTFGQIVGRQFYRYFVTCQDANAISAQSSSKVSEDHAIMFQLNAELSGWELLQHCASHLNAVVFAHKPPRSGWRAEPKVGTRVRPAETVSLL